MFGGKSRLIDLVLIFSIVSVIMIMGFLGNLLFKKTDGQKFSFSQWVAYL